jgi:DNA-binding NarL/FixJ family response regulator
MCGSEGATRILLVDDHVIFRDGIREILENEDDLVVVGEAGTSSETITLAEQTRPDVIVLDVEIPGEPVTNTVARLRHCAHGSRVVILSMYDEPQMVRQLLGLGVRGYLLKTVTAQELISAIRGVSTDDERTVLAVSSASLTQLHGAGPGPLSDRELEIMNLVAQAMSNSQIAYQLRITEGTVKRHLRNVFAKLGAVSRIDAVNKATAASLLPRSRSRGRSSTTRQAGLERGPVTMEDDASGRRHRHRRRSTDVSSG